MRRDTVNYLTVGSFVLAMAVAFVVVLLAITGRRGPTDAYYVIYHNVTGVKPGTPVLYEGYQVGQVEKVTPQPSAQGLRYRVELSVRQGWPVPRDSVAKIAMSGLLSAVSIEILEGRARQLLTANSEIPGREGDDLFAAINDVASDARRLIDESAQPLLQSLNRRVDGVAANVEAQTTAAFQDLRKLLAKLDRSADSLGEALGQDNRRQLASFLSNVNTFSKNFLQVSQDVRHVTGALDRLLADADGLVQDNREDFRASVQDLRTSMRVIAERIDSVSYRLDGASRNLNEFSRQIRENPALLLGTTRPTKRALQ